MLYGRIHRAMHEDEAGQTLVLGAVSMLILALSVMVTVQLGHTIHQRMRLQDGADAAAYSQAAVAARSLNYIAFANRTIVAHYVSMMGAQSILSHAYGFHATLNLLSLGLNNVSTLACLFSWVPMVGQALAAISRVASFVSRLIDQWANVTKQVIALLHGAVKLYVSGLGLINFASMHAATDWFRAKTAMALMDPGKGGVARRSLLDNCGYQSEACFRSGVGANNGYGFQMSRSAWAYGSMIGMLPSEVRILPALPTPPKINSYWKDHTERREDSWQSAERLMAEIANASRTPTESNRRFGLPGPVEALIGWAVSPNTRGTTRFVRTMTPGQLRDKGSNYLFKTGEFTSQFSRGPAIASTERAALDGIAGSIMVLGKEVLVGVHTAPEKAGFHCEWGGARSLKIPFCGKLSLPKAARCYGDPDGDNHDAPGALSKYTSFEPLNQTAYEKIFNQPTFWGLAYMTPEDASLPADLGFGFQRSGTFRWGLWGQANAGDRELLPGAKAHTAGLHAWARGRVYYHRPGYWTEPPNLFNPFWRAKLSPINPLASMLELGLVAGSGGIPETALAAPALLQH